MSQEPGFAARALGIPAASSLCGLGQVNSEPISRGRGTKLALGTV